MSDNEQGIELKSLSPNTKTPDFVIDTNSIKSLGPEDLENQIESTQKVLLKTTKQIRELNEEIAKTNREIEKAKDYFFEAQKDANTSTIRAYVGGRSNKLSKNEAFYQSQIETLEDKNNDQITKLKGLNELLEDGLNYSQALYEQKIKNTNQTITSQIDAISGLKADLETKNMSLEDLSTKLLQKENLISIQERGLQTRDDSLASIQEKLENSQNTILTQQSDIQTIKDNIGKYQSLKDLDDGLDKSIAQATITRKEAINEAQQLYELAFFGIGRTFEDKIKTIQKEYQGALKEPIDLSALAKAKEKADKALNDLNQFTQQELQQAKNAYLESLRAASSTYVETVNAAKEQYTLDKQDIETLLPPELLNPLKLQEKTLEKIDLDLSSKTQELESLISLNNEAQKDLNILIKIGEAKEVVANQQIQLQQQLIEQLQRANDDLIQQKSVSDKALKEAQKTIEENNVTILRLQEKNLELQEIINQQKAKLDDLENKISNQNLTIGALEDRVNSLSNENKALKEQVFSQQLEILELKSQLSDLQTALNEAQIKITSLTADVSELKGNLAKAQEENTNLKTQIDKNEENITQLTTELTKLQTSIENTDPAIFKASAELLREQLNEADFTQHKELLKNPSPENLLTILMQSEFNQDQIDSIKSNTLLETLYKAAGISKEVSVLSKENLDLQSTINENKDKISDLEKDIGNKDNQISQIEEENRNLSEKNTALLFDQDKLQQDIKLKIAQIESQDEELKRTQKSLVLQETTYKTLQEEWIAQNTRLDLYETAFVAQLNDIEKLKGNLDQQIKSNQDLQNELQSKTQEIDKLKSDMSQIQLSVDTLTKENGDLQTQYLSAQKLVTSAQEKLNRLTPEYETLKNNERDLLNQVKDLEAQKAQLESANPNDTALIGNISSAINALDNQIAQNRILYENIALDMKKAEDNIKTFSGVSHNLQSQIDLKFEKLIQLDDQLQNKSSKISTLTNDLVKAKNENTTLVENSKELQQKVEDLTHLSQQQQTELDTLRSMASLHNLAQKWNMKLFNVELNQNPAPLTSTNTTVNIANQDAIDEVYNKGTQLKNKDSGISYTFKINKDTNTPQAILDDNHNPKNEADTAKVVMNIIDNILANGNKVELKTANPLVAAVTEQYLAHLETQGIQFEKNIQLTAGTAKTDLDLKTLVPDKFKIEPHEHIFTAMKEKMPSQPNTHTLTPNSLLTPNVDLGSKTNQTPENNSTTRLNNH